MENGNYENMSNHYNQENSNPYDKPLGTPRPEFLENGDWLLDGAQLYTGPPIQQSMIAGTIFIDPTNQALMQQLNLSIENNPQTVPFEQSTIHLAKRSPTKERETLVSQEQPEPDYEEPDKYALVTVDSSYDSSNILDSNQQLAIPQTEVSINLVDPESPPQPLKPLLEHNNNLAQHYPKRKGRGPRRRGPQAYLLETEVPGAPDPIWTIDTNKPIWKGRKTTKGEVDKLSILYTYTGVQKWVRVNALLNTVKERNRLRKFLYETCTKTRRNNFIRGCGHRDELAEHGIHVIE